MDLSPFPCQSSQIVGPETGAAADIIFFSAAVDEPRAFRLTSPWTWPFDIRWRRVFNIVR